MPPPGQVPPKSRVADGKRWIELPARDQLSFVARSTEDLVPPDAVVRDIAAVMETFSYLPFEVHCSGRGRPTWHPRFICTILVYAATQGVQSAREISRRLERDTHFMWLAREQSIDHETLSDFRRKYRPQLHDLFKQTVLLAMELGMVDLTCVAIDGTKVAACARREMLKPADLEERLGKLDASIQAILDEAEAVDAAEDAELGESTDPCPADEAATAHQAEPGSAGDAEPGVLARDKAQRRLARLRKRHEKLLAARAQLQSTGAKRVSVTDPQAPEMKTTGGAKRAGYNGQIAVDSKVGIAIAESLTTDQNDTLQFEPVAEQAIANVGQVPQCMVADTGYHSAEALEYVDRREDLNAYIKQQKVETNGRYGHDDFIYDGDSNTLTCPAGRCLTYRGTKTLDGQTYLSYLPEQTCSDCPQREQCIDPEAKTRKRTILLVPHHKPLTAMRTKLTTPEGQQALKDRSSTVERVFGTIKSVLGLTQFNVRGSDNAAAQFTVAVAAYNVKKIVTCLGSQGAERLLAARQGV